MPVSLTDFSRLPVFNPLLYGRDAISLHKEINIIQAMTIQIYKIDGTAKELYPLVGPLVMNPAVLK